MYIITGATGNTGKEITEGLLKAGKAVTVIGRSAERLQPLTAQGAIAAVGDLEDTAFLTKTFAGATAVYVVIPPKWDLTTDWRTYQRVISTSITNAIREAGVHKVVVLSSNGAHLPTGAGPVTGLYELEQMLQAVPNLDILTLRAGYFMQNLFASMGMMKHMGIFGYSLGGDVKTPLVHTRDIAEVAIKYLLSLDFQGFKPVFVSGAADLSMNEAAQILGKAIGNLALAYVAFPYADAKAGMMQNGIPETIADGYNELFKSLNDGLYLNDYKRDTASTTSTSLHWFAENEFVHAYNAQA